MSTSASTNPFELKIGAKISRGTLGYIRTRARQWAYNLLISEFKKSGLTQAELCRRLDKSPEVVSRMFNRPANFELDTLSATVFAITGGILNFSIRLPVRQAGVVSLPAFTATNADSSSVSASTSPLGASGNIDLDEIRHGTKIEFRAAA